MTKVELESLLQDAHDIERDLLELSDSFPFLARHEVKRARARLFRIKRQIVSLGCAVSDVNAALKETKAV